MTFALICFAIGMALSAFFSGSETGMYRVPRIRLVLDGLSGSRIARGLVWLLNNPALFVATTLVGNNVANYMVSLAIVLGTAAVWPGGGETAELLGPVFLTPFVFVFGELLPKYLFFHAPHRLLKITGGPFLIFTVILFPLTVALGLLGHVLSLITGEPPFRVRLGMARSELEQVLREGQEAGLLSGAQRVLAQNVFQIGNQPAIRFGVSPDRLPVVNQQADTPAGLAAARSAARRQGHPIVLVRSRGQIIGYYWYADLVTATDEQPPTLLSVLRGSADQKHFSVLLEMCESESDVAILVSRDLNLKSVVTRRQLLQPLMAPLTA
ncbi:CNNM domain-containing protein [Planctomycetaceae bacterium SH139]